MNTSRSWLEKFNSRIRNNKIAATLIIVGSAVIGISTFTNATRNLANLVHMESRPAVNGEWNAEVIYDWPNAKYAESFSLNGDGEELHGAASFLGVKRGILDGTTGGNRLEFTIRTQEATGDAGKNVAHHYKGKLMGDEIHFVMQTEGSVSAHVPVEFVARRASGASAERAP